MTEIHKPEHIQLLCQRQNMPSKHYRGTFDQAHAFVGRKHVKGKSEKYLVLYLAQKRMSHILLIAVMDMKLN